MPHYDGTVLAQFITDLAPQTYTSWASRHGDRHGLDRRSAGHRHPDRLGSTVVVQREQHATVIAQGEASGTISMHLRDPETAAPLDLIQGLPEAHQLSERRRSDRAVDRAASSLTTAGTRLRASYLPWLLTGDPYYLEALQFQANIEIIGEPASGRYTWAGRYGAWPLRNKLYAAVASPDDPPRWLLARSVFHQHMEGVRAEALKDMASEDPILAVFRARQFGGSQGTPAHPSGTYAVFWQCAFESLVYGMCVQLGFDEWSEQLTWKIDSEVQRTNGDAWPRSAPCPYNTGLVYTCSLTAAITRPTRSSRSITTAAGRGRWSLSRSSARTR